MANLTKAVMIEKLLSRGVNEEEFKDLNATDLKVVYDAKKLEFEPEVNEVSDDCVTVEIIQ
jgi:hypothetical protein